MERVLGGDPARIFVIGHPRGLGLHFSIDGCRLLDHDDRALQYLADDIPRLNGDGTHAACEAVSLLAVREALRSEFG